MGIDSAVTASLAVKTKLSTTVLILPSKNNQHQYIQDVLELAEKINIEHRTIAIQTAYKTFLASTQKFTNTKHDR